MMKNIVIVAALVCLAHSQRPPYAGSSNRYPVVLPQFLTTVANSIGNRIDSNNDQGSAASFTTPSTTTTTISPLDLPVDAHGDIDLINRIKMWPRDKQPFWFINWQQIQAHRGGPNVPGQATQPPQTDSRSFFAG